ncbi:hypothetical protein EUTSA_v10000769mg [Eutrema salsugineum]|uniref:Uncharacterized protein n=1 Tax=Eutrema salsugineum TaxID=72664 RepID=V4N3L0_EUTSA|nr:probable disease resistance protein At5g47260 [Eutrema salsugineum]ESQ39876.1 hypothetical protein EUTSA_v10000769mg [Eutrema salsugineum]
MGVCFSIQLDKSLDQLVPPFLRYLCWNNLENNLESLQRCMQDLSEMRDDLLRLVSKEEDRGLQMFAQVKVWISRVGTVESETNRLLDDSIVELGRFSMYGCCSLISGSTYRYSQKVDMTLEKVNTLIREGRFEVVTERLVSQRAPHKQQPTDHQPTGSRANLLESIWRRLMDENVSTLGIYGMGGVGKTTLLVHLNNKLSEVGHNYGYVIFVVVASKEIEDIQDEIGKRLGLQWGRETKKEKAAEIFQVLKIERFILLLDDIQREGVDLQRIGVPQPSRENGCKIVFTTRSQEVCRRIKWVEATLYVECLPPQEAWDLFQKTVGEYALTSHPDIPGLARVVAEKCFGLPLALTVVGKTMSSKRTVHEWHHAIHLLLSSSSSVFSGLEDILSALKFSYDSLPDEETRSCFLYCALFPEGDDIKRQDLVNYWVGEGLVSHDIKGYEMINDLVRASLLMEDESGYGVKMHGMFREMALWIIACDYERQYFVVKGGIKKMPSVIDWRRVRRMSVTDTQIENISDSPDCSELTTLLLQRNYNLEWISGDFFRRMASLVVLDLSHNSNLSELPEEVSCLVSLRLLNLSGTNIKDLPKSFGELLKLIHLDLESTSNLRSISLISGLLKLQVLRFYGSKASLDLSLLKQFECLKYLKLLTITVRDVHVLKTFLRSRLAGFTQGLYLEGLKVSGESGKSFAATFGALGSLRNVEMVNCDIIESDMVWEDDRRHQYSPSNQTTPRNPWFMNLSTVVILSCTHLKDLTWLIYAANLVSLTVKASSMMEEVICKEKAGNVEVEPFQRLQVLDLDDLSELKSIYWTSLSFPRLRKVNLTKCPNLRKLPLSSTSVEKIYDLRIEVEEAWLQRVEWESTEAEERFRRAIHRASVY